MNKKRRANDGFSLLEILLSLILLAAVFTGGFQVWNYANRSGKFQEEDQAVEIYLDRKLAELKNEFDRTGMLPATLSTNDLDLKLQDPVLSIDIRQASPVKQSVKLVKLTLSWSSQTMQGHAVRPKEKSLTTLFFKE